MHVVIVRFSSLGDIILQTPLMSWLKLSFPNLKISFVTSREFSSLVEGHPHIDSLYYLDRSKGLKDIKNIQSLANQIQETAQIDFVIDLHNTLRAKILRFFISGIPKIVVDKRSILRKILIYFKWDLMKNLPSHHERLIKDFAFLFGLSSETKNFQEKLSSQSEFNLTGLTTTPYSFKQSVNDHAYKYLVISPVASFQGKRWPIESVNKFMTIFLDDERNVGLDIIIVAGPGDTYCKELLDGPRVLNLQGKTNLEQTLKIISHAEFCFTNDTGSLHMAESFGIPTLSLFGPTSESFGFRPHLLNSKSLSVDIWCRPCSGTGSKKCFRSEQFCMSLLTAEKVYDEFMQMKLKRGQIV